VTIIGTECSVCGGNEYRPGFKGRMVNGKAPECATCGSAERHRIIRRMYNAIRPLTSEWTALQFAPDGSVTKQHFKSFDCSSYGGYNSMPMEKMTAADGAYDIVISNHVMEHVEDPIKSIQESLRVVGNNGFVHICVPAPMFVWETTDWGFPDPKQNEHFRIYGADAGIVFARTGSCHCVAVIGLDDATAVQDVVYLLSRSTERLAAVTHTLQRNGFGVVRVA